MEYEEGDGDDRSNRGFFILVRTSTEFKSLKEEHKFYHIVENDDKSKNSDLIPPVLDTHLPYRVSGKYRHGSKLYFLGGINVLRRGDIFEPVSRYEHLSNEFWYFDFDDHVYQFLKSDGTVEFRPRKKSIEWKKGPSMITRRLDPAIAIVDQNMYVFGGDNECYSNSDEPPSCEVYDFQSEKWSPLHIDLLFQYEKYGPHPDNCFRDRSLSYLQQQRIHVSEAIVWHDMRLGPDPSRNTVILLHVGLTGYLYSYHTSTGEFEVFDPLFGPEWLAPYALSCNDDVLLNFDGHFDNLLYGYHLIRKKWYVVKGLEGDKVLPELCFDSSITRFMSQFDLFSLGGGKVCIIWAQRHTYQQRYRFFYTKFTVEEIEVGNDNFILQAKAEPVRTFRIRGAEEYICSLNIEHHKGFKRSYATSDMETNEDAAAAQQQ